MTVQRWRSTVGLAVLAGIAAGCVHSEGGRVADTRQLVGPFRKLASEPRPTTIATSQPPPAPTSAPAASDQPVIQTQPESHGSDTPTTHAASNGLFSLRDGEMLQEQLGRTEEGEDSPEAAARRHHLFAPVEETEDSFWYLDLGFRTGVTRLGETEQQLDRRVSLPLQLDVFNVFADPNTPLDRKSELALTTGYIGVGRRETEWLTWNFYFGSGVGADRERQRWLNANLDVNFRYALYYTGLTVDIYPWGLSQRGRFATLVEHLKASRPYAVTGIEVGYLKAKGWGHFALAPVTLYADEQEVEDWLFGYLAGLGWEVPINDRWAFNLQGHYTFHAYRPTEYNGWNITTALRYRF